VAGKKPSVPERLETVILICACGCMFHREGQWGREIVRDEKSGVMFLHSITEWK